MASKFFYFQPHGVFNPKPVFAIIKFVDIVSTVIVVVVPAIVPSSRLIIAIPSERLLTPVLLNSDLVYCLLMTLLAVSNGYLTRFNMIMIEYNRAKQHNLFIVTGIHLSSVSSVVMVWAPRRVTDHEQQTASSLMVDVTSKIIIGGINNILKKKAHL